MKVTLVSICRRKHRIQNSNLNSRSFRYGYLLLSFLLLFSVSVPVFGAVDTSGSVVVDNFELDLNYMYFYGNSDSVTVYSSDFVSSSFANYNKVSAYTVQGSFTSDFIYPINCNFSSCFNYDYIVFSVNVGALSSVILPTSSSFFYYSPGYEYFGDADSIDSIIVNYTGVDFTGVNLYFIFKVDDLYFLNGEFFAASVDWQLSGGEALVPFVSSPLKFQFYRNIDDVIADINRSVNELTNQNNIIIQNQNDIKIQLNSIHNSLSSDKNPDNSELDSELSDANQIEQDFKDKFQDFVDIDKIDRVENIITDWTNNTKILSSFIFVRNVLDLLFDEVPVLSILFSVGSACIILTMLFGIVSHSFRSPSGNVAQDPRSYTYNYIMFSNLSQQQTLSSKKADFHAFEKFDGSWGV